MNSRLEKHIKSAMANTTKGLKAMGNFEEDKATVGIVNAIEAKKKFEKMTNEELVAECARTEAADYMVVGEMMKRLAHNWYE